MGGKGSGRKPKKTGVYYKDKEIIRLQRKEKFEIKSSEPVVYSESIESDSIKYKESKSIPLIISYDINGKVGIVIGKKKTTLIDFKFESESIEMKLNFKNKEDFENKLRLIINDYFIIINKIINDNYVLNSSGTIIINNSPVSEFIIKIVPEEFKT